MHLGHFQHLWLIFVHNRDTYHPIENIFIFNLRRRIIKLLHLLGAFGAHIDWFDSGNRISNLSGFFKIVNWSHFFEHFEQFIIHIIYFWVCKSVIFVNVNFYSIKLISTLIPTHWYHFWSCRTNLSELGHF